MDQKIWSPTINRSLNMPGFRSTIPQPNDDLSVSQGDLLLNFQSCNTSFSVDHYPFTDLTVNDGKHNQVTTPVISGNAHPITIANEPKFYAMTQAQAGSTLPIGTIQYSRGPLNAVPSPITYLQAASPYVNIGSGATANVVDFTGLTDCQFIAYCSKVNTTGNLNLGVFSGHYYLTPAKTIRIQQSIAPTGCTFIDAGNGILQIQSTSAGAADFTWTLQILRIQS